MTAAATINAASEVIGVSSIAVLLLLLLAPSANYGDTITGGAGNDTIVGNTGLTTDNVDGGTGTNTLNFTEDLGHALEDADFTNVTNFQSLTPSGLLSGTIGTEAAEAGHLGNFR